MSTRLKVLLSDWVRQTLRAARADSPGDPARKLAIIRAAAYHAFPTADVEQMLAEIESGRSARCADPP